MSDSSSFDWRLIGYALSVFGIVWSALWTFVKWALPAKVKDIVNGVVDPRLERIETMLKGKADSSEMEAMERRFEKRMEPYLAAIKENTASSAASLEGMNEKLRDLAERVSYMEGSWDGITDRRQHQRRSTD